MNIGGQDDDIGRGDFGRGQALSGSDGALSFDPDFLTHGGGGAFQRFSRHHGVSDSSWAGSDSNDLFHSENLLKSFEDYRKLSKASTIFLKIFLPSYLTVFLLGVI